MEYHKRGIFLVSIGTIFFSTSPVLTRWVGELPVGEIAFFRMLFGALFIYIIAKANKTELSLKYEDIPKFLIYGFITSLHFLLYIASLMYTTIAHSLSLIYTAPVMITLMTAYLLKESLPRYKYIGIIIVILGIIILAGFEPVLTREMLLGDVMAVGSAFCLALYSIAGRRERDNFSHRLHLSFLKSDKQKTIKLMLILLIKTNLIYILHKTPDFSVESYSGEDNGISY